MKTPKTGSGISSIIINIVLGLIFLSLVYVGVRLITQSENLSARSFTTVLQNGPTVTAVPSGPGATAKPNPVIAPNYSVTKDGYSQALSFFMLAIGCVIMMLLLPRLQNLSIGPAGINLTLQNLQQSLSNMVQQSNTIQATSAGPGGMIQPSGPDQIKQMLASLLPEEKLKLEASEIEDSQKGRWGEEPERNSRRLSATVSGPKSNGFFGALITVENTSPNIPLTGIVKFHLHHSFKNPNPVIAVQNGKAVLELKKVLGPFTIGAETDSGKTILELDLSTVKDAPSEFYKK